MKPLELTISGLHSYREPVKIDFSPAIEAQIFGIFGHTGGGKSTILDAITLALFGRTDRLGRSLKEAINPHCQELSVSLTFEVAGKVFKVSRTIPREGRSRVLLWRKQEDRLQEIAEKDQEVSRNLDSILGIAFEDFIRMVILPQGKFDRFLFLRPEERARMLGRILNLERLGEPLYEQVREECQRHLRELEGLKGQLEALRWATPEALTKLNRRIKALAWGREQLDRKLKKVSQRLSRLKELKEWLEQEQRLEFELKTLTREAPKIKELKTKLRLAQALAPHSRDLKRLRDIDTDIDREQKAKERLLAQLDKAQERLKKAEERHESFEKRYSEELENLSARAEKAQRALKLEERRQKANEEIKNLHGHLKGILAEIDQVKKQQHRLQQSLWSLEARKKKISLELAQLKFGKKEKELLKLLEASPLSEALALEKTWREKRKRKKKIKEALEEKGHRLAQEFNLSFVEAGNLLQQIKGLLDRLQQEKERLLLEIQAREIINQLAENLKAGLPCPVCGSREHPSPAQKKKDSETSQRLRALEDQIKKIKRFLEEAEGLTQDEARLKALVEEITLLGERTNQIRSEIINQTGLPPLFSLADLQREKERLLNLHYQETDLREESRRVLEQLGRVQQEALQLQEKLVRLGQEKEQLSVRLRERQRELAELNQEIRELTGKVSPDKLIIKIQTQMEELNREKNRLKEEVTELRQHSQGLEKKAAEIREHLNQLYKEKKTLLTQTEELKRRFKATLEELYQLLLPPEVMKELEEQIQSFEKRQTSLASRLEEVRRKINDLGPGLSPEEIPALEDLKTRLEKAIGWLNQQMGRTTEAERRLREALKQRKDLLRQEKETRAASELAHELKRLIQGKALVKFATRFYLAQVVSLANQMLEDLSGGRLFLAPPDEELNLAIHDLAAGNVRSVKTLSGGERFLVSFSLALGLSGYIQAQRAKPINFFFVDEGFGSLDADLQQQVAKVLERMLAEGRVVGLITHLEAFREIVPAYFWVEKDPQHGSRVRFIKNFV